MNGIGAPELALVASAVLHALVYADMCGWWPVSGPRSQHRLVILSPFSGWRGLWFY